MVNLDLFGVREPFGDVLFLYFNGVIHVSNKYISLSDKLHYVPIRIPGRDKSTVPVADAPGKIHQRKEAASMNRHFRRNDI